jgi:hypothetical protein
MSLRQAAAMFRAALERAPKYSENKEKIELNIKALEVWDQTSGVDYTGELLW